MTENNQGKKFKVTISDDDYLNFDLNNDFSQISKNEASGEKFEVKFDDSDFDFLLNENIDIPEDISFESKAAVPSVPIAKPSKAQENNSLNFQFENNSSTQEQKEKTNKSKKTVVKKKEKKSGTPLFFVIFVFGTILLSLYGVSCVNDLLAFGRKDESVTVTVPNDATTDDIIDLLADNGLVKQSMFCKLYYKAFDYVKNIHKTKKTAPVYLSGVYDVEKNLGLEGYLSEFKQAQVSNETVSAVFPEGWSIYQICDRLEKYEICSRSKMLAALKNASYDYSFLNVIEDDSNRTFKLEGYLYPDTYEFYADSDANSVIRKMLDRFDEMWTDSYQKRAKELGYTCDEILTIASIIQREAADKSQMSEISSVIHNRLNHRASWPTLGCDSTLKYITNNVAPYISESDAFMYQAAYNTSNNGGLPPGPICCPGEDAIDAALNPDDTNYYFFRHDKNGQIYLASTQSEHDYNAKLVLKANNN